MSDLVERSKVNLDLWNLFIAIVLLVLTFQVRIMNKAGTVFKKINFSKKIPFKCIRKQRGMCIKGLFWPPLEPKTESCFSPISSFWFIRRIAQV